MQRLEKKSETKVKTRRKSEEGVKAEVRGE